MDDRVIKAALDSFENDDFLHAKQLVQGQIKQAKNDFLKAKLGLKNDLDNQFTQAQAGDSIKDTLTPNEPEEIEPEPEEIPKPKKRMLSKKKKL